MKYTIQLTIPVEIEITDPAKARALFSDGHNKDNPFKATPFISLRQYAMVSALACVDDEANQEFTAPIDAAYGRIVARTGSFEVASIECRNAAGNLIKTYQGQSYKRIEGGPDCSCDDCAADYSHELCVALCGGGEFDCHSNIHWEEVISDYNYALDCDECRECLLYGSCTALLANSGKATMPCPAVALARDAAQRALGKVKGCGDCGKLERWQTGRKHCTQNDEKGDGG